MAHFAHALHGSAIRRALKARNFNLEPKQLNALSSVFNPVLAAVEVVPHAAQKFISNAAQFKLINILNQIAEPLLRPSRF